MVVAVGISFSIANKPGIAPGLVVGMVANAIGAGFIGGLVGGFISGWIALAIIRYVKVPSWARGLMPTLVIPFLASLLSGLIMAYIIGGPISALTRWLTSYVMGLDTSQKFVYGVIIGILSSVDYGGAINKAVYALMLALQSSGVNEPITVLMLASMVTPIGYTAAYFIAKFIRKPIYTPIEVETLKTAFPMGLVMITEGSLPIVMNDLIRCIVATGVGAAVGGGLSMVWGADSHVPHGGLFAMATMTRPWAFLMALLIGSLVTGLVLVALKKRLATWHEIEKKEEVALNESTVSFL